MNKDDFYLNHALGGFYSGRTLIQASGKIGGHRSVFVNIVGNGKNALTYPTFGGILVNPFKGRAKIYAGDVFEFDPGLEGNNGATVKILKYYEVAKSAGSETAKTQAEVTLRHKKVVLIVDEAHLVCANKRYETLQEIRFLLNNNCDSDNNIALILAGQNELWDLLGVEKYRAITQRINFVCKLHPLTTDEVFDYISAHMRYSKAPDSIFTTESINLIAAHSKGIPRVINTICKHSLIYAASKNETLINDEIVQAVIDNELPPCAIC